MLNDKVYHRVFEYSIHQVSAKEIKCIFFVYVITLQKHDVKS